MLCTRTALLLIVASAPCLAEEEVKAEVAGASITLPAGWTAKAGASDLFVQARYQSPSGEEYVNAGSLLLPSYSLDEFAAMALVPLLGRPSEAVDRVAAATSIPRDDLVKFLERTAGPQFMSQVSQLAESDWQLLRMEKTTVDSRRAYRCELVLRLPERLLYVHQLVIEGYSPGQYVLTGATSSELDGELFRTQEERIQVRDTRPAESSIPGYIVRWPEGTFAPGKAPLASNASSSTRQIPLGPAGALQVHWIREEHPSAGGVRGALDRYIADLKRSLPTQKHMVHLADVETGEGGHASLPVAFYEYAYDFQGSADRRMATRVYIVGGEGPGLLTIWSHAPVDRTAALRRVMGGIVEALEPITPVAPNPAEAGGTRSGGGLGSVAIAVEIAVSLVLGLAALAYVRRHRRRTE